MRSHCEAGNQPAIRSGLKESLPFVCKEPTAIIISPEIVRISLQRVFICRLREPIRRTGSMVGIGPRTIDVGKLNDAVWILFGALKNIVVIIRIVIDPRTN